MLKRVGNEIYQFIEGDRSPGPNIEEIFAPTIVNGFQERTYHIVDVDRRVEPLGDGACRRARRDAAHVYKASDYS